MASGLRINASAFARSKSGWRCLMKSVSIAPSMTVCATWMPCGPSRSEEHTSELQSLMRISYAVFCLNKNKNLSQQHPTTASHKNNEEIMHIQLLTKRHRI